MPKSLGPASGILPLTSHGHIGNAVEEGPCVVRRARLRMGAAERHRQGRKKSFGMKHRDDKKETGGGVCDKMTHSTLGFIKSQSKLLL